MRAPPNRSRKIRTGSILLIVALVAVLAPRAGSGGADAAGATPSGGLTARQLAAGAGHACIVGPGPATVEWSHLHNPILSSPVGGVKDQALIWAGGTWHLLFSYVTEDRSLPGGIRWNVATATSPNLVHWSAITPWPEQSGVLGVASPDIVREPDGRFLVTYQSDPGASSSEDQARLFYRTSIDLRSWSAPHPLAQALAPAPQDRMIDGALVDTGHQLLLGFKYSAADQPDVFEIARSVSGQAEGPWRLVGQPQIEVDGGTIENYEFVMVDGRWRLVATSDNLDQPWLFTLDGNPADAGTWLHWSAGVQLQVPLQAFNSGPGISSIGYEHANSAFLCDAGPPGGHTFYLLYAGSTELTQFDGWGHARIGVARSSDLVHWQVPGG